MNGIHQNVKNRKFERTHPGCLGKMVNLFELNVGISAKSLLTDKPHRDGSPLSRSRSDVSRISPSGDDIQEKVVVHDYMNNLSSRKSHGTPMKTLIAQEMSKDVNPRHDPPNLVAKLMGLDALPEQEPDTAIRRRSTRVHSRSHSDSPMCYWERQNGFFHYEDPNACQDCYDTWQQPQKSVHKGRYKETINDEKMNLVRQKFIEVKCLSMDEKLRQSKQFQDALEVLSSNKELFLKCLQEPNSMLNQRISRKQSVPSPIGTQRITVLRPSKVADCYNLTGTANKDGKQMKDAAFLQPKGLEKIHRGSSPPESSKYYENPAQPTRIVVLKPSPGRSHDIKSVSPQPQAEGIIHVEDFFGDVEDDENKKSRAIAKAITQQMREKLRRHCREETLTSSVYSNGCVGDESSFNKSETEYAEGNLSDSEVMSPVSRHFWGYANMLGSPYSSSVSRASYSPESSVCREAKKRLSERWAMMASNGSCPEPRHFRRSSSTLGEMLALSEAKSAACPGEGCSCEETRLLNSLDNDLRQDENMNSPRNLTRSKSVPVSCTEFGIRLNTGISILDNGKPVTPKEDTKAQSGRSSFKGKVSNLLFSRNKKPGKDKPLESGTRNEFPSFPGRLCTDRTESHTGNGSDHASPGLQESLSKASYSTIVGKQGMKSPEANQVVAKPIAPTNRGENEDYLNPVWVLYQRCDVDEQSAIVFPHYAEPDQQGMEAPCSSIGSNLIDKSPPIGSIARTLSWDASCVDKSSTHFAREASNIRGTDEDKQEWFSFIKTLLTVAGFDGEMQSKSFLGRWHSPESPLDPLLRDEYINLHDKETLHGTKVRQTRSMQRLVFDCVNAALVEIAGYGAYSGERASPYEEWFSGSGSSKLVDEVWARMNALFSDAVRFLSDDCGDDNSPVVESMVRKEVADREWIDNLRSERDILGKEIEEKLLEELVHEAVGKLTGIV